MLAAAFPSAAQDYLLEARQIQAFSFAVHIPLVCYGIAFPTLVLFADWLHVRTGDPLYRTLAKRWSKVMLALFAVGVVTRTILSFEMRLLWPNFLTSLGDVFRLGFALEGFSFFRRGDPHRGLRLRLESPLAAGFLTASVYAWAGLRGRSGRYERTALLIRLAVAAAGGALSGAPRGRE